MRYILAIAICTAYFWLGLPAVYAVPALLALTLLRTGRSRRRGGYVKPPASPITSPGAAPPARTSTSSKAQPGPLWGADWQARRLLRDPSRLTERGWSTAATETHGASGPQLLSVGWPKTYGAPPRSDGAPAVAPKTFTVVELGDCGCGDTAA